MLLSQLIKKVTKNDSSENLLSVHSINTPVGTIYAAADENFLYVVTFEDSKNVEKTFQILSEKLSCGYLENKNKVLIQLEVEIESYFKGTLKKFSVPLKTFGSDFQQTVWDKLRDLPYGVTLTYGDLAKSLGKPPSHARAIGAACGANPHLLLTPCHRIVASGSKGGFSCGVDRKEWLLQHEKKFDE